MAKRRASNPEDDSDVDEPEATSPKRARVEEEEEVPEENEEQKQFEARFGEDVRTALEQRNKLAGRVAEQGIIQSLEMHQFMCHPRLSFTFGPQINFIIGHNGSGKSAVLSALTVALGGKATSTGRGSGLKSFIREGQNAAEVTITIKNEGEDAYKPQIYGKSIVVTRRFTKEGSSSYKIKSKDGKTISAKREELSAICDHMNIQVDNPLNILSQDSARQFLSASHPKEKYEFFLKGTQLKQLSNEYETILENIQKTYKVLEAKRQVVPDLKKAVQEAQARYKGAQKAIETKEKIHELKLEQAWAFVKEREKEMSDNVNDVARATRKIPRLKEQLATARTDLENVNEEIASLERQRTGLGNINHLHAREKDINDKMRENKQKIREYMDAMKGFDNELRRLNAHISELEANIKRETQKLQVDKQAEREERQREIEARKSAHEEASSQIQQVNDKIRACKELQSQLQAQGNEAKGRAEEAQMEMRDCGQHLNNLERSVVDQLSAYGNNMKALRESIDRSRWYGEKPVGPLGAYVSLVEPGWRTLLQTILGSMMTAFAITDGRDRNSLRKLLQDTNNKDSQIVVAEKDIFDYSSGEPPAGIKTIVRVLKFENEYVKRIFINQHRIERTFLANTRKEGEQIAESLGGGTAMTADLMRVQVQRGGGYYSVPLRPVRPGDRQAKFFACGNLDEEKQSWKARGRDADARYRVAESERRRLEGELSESNREVEKLNQEARKLEGDKFRARQNLSALQEEANEDIPVNISALESTKQEEEDSKEMVMRQFQELAERKATMDAEQNTLLGERNHIQGQVGSFTDERGAVDNLILQATDKRTQVDQNIKHWQEKLNQQEASIVTLNDKAEFSQKEYEAWTKSAEDLCEGKRFENPRLRREIERQLNSIINALKDQEKENGATIEQLEETLYNAIRKYESTHKDIQDISNLNKALKHSINVRINRWRDFRRHIALRTKMQFQLHLSKRGYFGKVLFDHEKERLELKVQTDDLASTQGLNKDPRSLSGGEKSFSTICLLLSLWEAIGCPIRCLDEFDVFMDAINRRISMRMMIDTANASDSKQYILITPQDMSNVAYGPSVRINRMDDPTRGQGTLAFS